VAGLASLVGVLFKKCLNISQKGFGKKISVFEQKSNNRFELAAKFINSVKQAEKYAQQENPEQGRDFLKKIGSNFRLSGQKLFLDFKNPFKILAEAEPHLWRGEAEIAQKSQSENWRCFLIDVRTFFEQNPQ